VGGPTIEQAKRNLTPAEFASWVMYFNQFGSINPSRRVEHAVAQLCVIVNHALGGHNTLQDYMPHTKQDDTISFEEAMENWE